MSKLMKFTFKLLDLIVIFVMMFSSPMSVLAQDPAPVLTPDKSDYLPGDIAQVTGTGFTVGNYVLSANSPAGPLDWGVVSAGEGGSFTTGSPALVAGTYQVNAYAEGSDVVLASVNFTVTAPLPTIVSDKSDYAPGELVTLTGKNWQDDAQVRIFVNESVSPIWSYEKIVNVDANGIITDSFILPNWFVAEYTVIASGQTTGRVVTTTFADAAMLTLTKSASPLTYTAAGQVINFSYILKNTGTTTLNGPFTVTDNKVPSVSCPAIVTLAAGASVTCTGTYTITSADLALGYAVNTAIASSSNPGATTSNTDVRIVSLPVECRNDSDGVNDEPGQKDLTQECMAKSSVNPLVISWNWDVISMSGNNSADGCALFDTDNNGLANYALCVSWQGARVLQAGYPQLYRCNDTRSDRCAGDAPLAISNGSACAVELASDDPFAAGDSYPQDTKAFCSINLADVGGATKSNLIDVCSYPSVQPNSDPSDCVVISTDKGNLQVIKSVVPDDTTTNWNLGWTGSTPYNTTVAGSGTTGIQAVNAGSYTVSEFAGTGTDLSLYDLTWACTVDGAPSTSGSGTTITGRSVAKGSVVICTFTNTRKTGSLEMKKVVSPNDPSANWNFAVTGPTAYSCSIAGSGTCGTKNVFTGSYSIAETAGSGTSLGDYGTSWACTVNGTAGPSGSGTTISGLTVNKSDAVVCTFTNSQNQATLIVKKMIVNDNGGAKGFADFSFVVNGGSPVIFEADGQNEISVNPGLYTVTEPAVTGYTTTYNNCSNISIPPGGTATCTITNNDQPGTLIVKKVLVNDNGGSKAVNDFSFSVNGGSAITFEADGQNDLLVNAGTYSVVETPMDGYSTTYNNCSNVVIPNGGSATCTITNNDQAATLIVIKNVINDNGGAKTAGDFTMSVGGTKPNPASFPGQEDPGTTVTLDAGSYNVTEAGPSGYTASYSTDCTGTIAVGQTKTCTVTNNDQPGTLIVKKVVVNDNGGSLKPENFTFSVNSGTPVAFEADGQNNLTVDAGKYTVTEPLVAGYSTTYENCTDVVVPNGGSATCTITNNDQAATLHVVKVVVNDNGGTKAFTDFSFSVNDGSAVAFEVDGQNDLSVPAGTYNIKETAAAGYTTTYNNCSNVVIPNGGDATCTITNDDMAPSLTLNKVVVNDNGGTAKEQDFTLTAKGPMAGNFVEQFSVNSQQSTPTYSTSSLQAGKVYRIEVSGTYSNGSTASGDAECRSDNGWVTPVDNGPSMELLAVYGSPIGTPHLNSVQGITAQDINWGNCASSHIYNSTLSGNGGKIGFVVSDEYWGDPGTYCSSSFCQNNGNL